MRTVISQGYKLLFIAIILLAKGATSALAEGHPFSGVEALAARRVPWLAPHLVFKQQDKTNGNDAFEISTKHDTVFISASGPNAAAVGLNWYLKYYCHRSISHMGDNLEPVSPLPVIKTPVRIDASAQIRYALNYCTYNYTMSFYTWQDWEHELDWMALNGVNTMLVANGEEAVWQNVLRKMGYTQDEINAFITGPAFNAWWLMGNIQGWGGPMPQTQIESRKLMVQRMIARMHGLGIEPVMPAFFGMVPSSLKTKIKAHIITQGTWGAFTRPDILDPTDTAFSRIAGLFYDETKKLYGPSIHFFSGDPFHEGGITDGVDLARAGLNIQQAMQQYFPGSVWVLQGWQVNPRKEMLAQVDKSKILVQELFGETTNNWEKRQAYEGTPFIWCMITNYGERPGLFGKLQRYADEPYRARNGEYSKYLKGIGIMPEGINNNPAAFDGMLEVGWHQERVDMAAWIKKYALYRYGKYNEDIAKAWQLLLQTIYSSPEGYQEGPPENILCARPALKIKSVSTWGTLRKNYDTAVFSHAVQLFAKAASQFKKSETYQIDLINFTRQVLANRADRVFAGFVAAYNQHDTVTFNLAKNQFLQLHDSTNDLLNKNAYFRLRTYQQQAVRAGNTPEEKANNLFNAMALISYWGENVKTEDNLHEYAYKEWGGMMISYYKKRWEMYFDYLDKQLKGQPAQAPDFFAWERKWAADNERIDPTLPYKELADPKPVNETSWQNLPAKTMVSFADIDTRYDKRNAPAITPGGEQWTTTAWRGEKVHTQLLIWTTALLSGVNIQTSDLKNNNGVKIPASAITTGFIRYVMTDGLNRSGSGCGIPPSNESDSSLAEDAIDIVPATNIEANTTQPVWLSISVPRGLSAGLYSGTLRISANGKEFTHTLHYSIKVSSHILPAPKDWKFHLDLWQNPYSVARVHSVKPWSKEHFDAMRPYMQMLAAAGQKAVTVSMIYDPWQGQTKDIYGTMIRWIKKKDRTWVYNYDIFDQWVRFMQSVGIDQLINCYSMEPWNLTYYYYDEATGKDTLVIAKPGTPEYTAHWRPMLVDFEKHLKSKGWFGKTAIAMDERPMEDMLQVIALIKSVDTNWKISLAGTYHAEIDKDIYDYCIGSSDKFDSVNMARRIRKGLPATYYTCCSEGYPNTFTFSPLAESAWLGWHAANKGYNGYLRWAYNCWPELPLQDSRFRSWSAGDTYLIYPGPRSSLRFERMIEGIQDYEKIRILRKTSSGNAQGKWRKARNTRTARQDDLTRLQVILKDFEISALKSIPAGPMLQNARAVLNAY